VKGVDIAVGVAQRRPDVPFVFVESWELNPLRRARLKRRLPPNVRYRPPVADMREVYAETKIVLVPSRWAEAWGRVVSEAQLSGIPALASDRGGLPESVGPGGLLLDPDADLDGWTEALARMWDDEAEYVRLAALAEQHARRPEFEPRAIAAALLTELEGQAARGEIRP
jgi:glycosyltransferase involved in cell wall biosynthesis